MTWIWHDDHYSSHSNIMDDLQAAFVEVSKFMRPKRILAGSNIVKAVDDMNHYWGWISTDGVPHFKQLPVILSDTPPDRFYFVE